MAKNGSGVSQIPGVGFRQRGRETAEIGDSNKSVNGSQTSVNQNERGPNAQSQADTHNNKGEVVVREFSPVCKLANVH